MKRLSKQTIIDGFWQRWLPKAGSYLGYAKLTQLLLTAGEKLEIKELTDAKGRIRDLVSYISDIAMGRYRDYSAQKLSIAIAGLVYLVTPTDFIPDFIAVAGWTDDITVLGFVCNQLADELIRYRERLPNPRESQTTDSTSPPLPSSED